MTTITIRTIGNRSLYRSLAESMDTETHHRTPTGAALRFVRLMGNAKTWQASCGRWGDIEIDINGVRLSDDETGALIWDYQDGAPGERVTTIARRLTLLIAESVR